MERLPTIYELEYSPISEVTQQEEHMSTWEELKSNIRSVRLSGAPWQSDQSSLLWIFTQAEALGISPDYASNITRSNLRTIIKLARMTIEDGDAFNLRELFMMAQYQSNLDLRLSIGSRVTEDIVVSPNEELGEGQFRIDINAEQLAKLESCSKMHFSFTKPHDNTHDWHALERYMMEVN
jgi:hypothetical protein